MQTELKRAKGGQARCESVLNDFEDSSNINNTVMRLLSLFSYISGVSHRS